MICSMKWELNMLSLLVRQKVWLGESYKGRKGKSLKMKVKVFGNNHDMSRQLKGYKDC